MNINQYIDHTLLKPESTSPKIILHCEQAMRYRFHCVCISGTHVSLAKSVLDRDSVRLCSVINFPLGSSTSSVVEREAEQALQDGADEIDTVINIGLLKSRYMDKLFSELQQLRTICSGKILKVILETCLLSDSEKEIASNICCDVGVDFIKTSTGFSSAGAKIEDIKLIKSVIDQRPVQIKASGGIRDYETAKLFIDAGASRIGTSNGIAISKNERSEDKDEDKDSY